MLGPVGGMRNSARSAETRTGRLGRLSSDGGRGKGDGWAAELAGSAESAALTLSTKGTTSYSKESQKENGAMSQKDAV